MGIKEILVKNKYVIILSLIILASVLIRIFPLRVFHWWDETVYLQHAEIMFSGRINYSELAFRPPFLSILFYLGYFIWHNNFMAHIIISIMQGLGIFFIYLLGKEIYNKKIGLLGATFLGFSPFYIKLGNMLIPGMTSVTLMIISFYLLIKKNNPKYAFLSGVFAAIAGLTKHPALFLIIVYFIMFLIRKIKFKQGVYLALGFLVGMLPYFIWAQVKFGFFLEPFISHTLRNLDNNLLANLNLYLIGTYEVFGIIILIGFLLYFLTKKDYYKWTFITWALIFIGIMLRLHAEARYLVHIIPPILLMSAKGYVNFLKKYYWLIIILILIIGIFSYLNFYNFKPNFVREYAVDGENLKEVIDVSIYLKDNVRNNEVVYTNFNYPVIAYYSNKIVKPIWLGTGFKDYYDALLNESGYLVYSYDGSDYREFFDENKNFIKKISFGNITVYELDIHSSVPFK